MVERDLRMPRHETLKFATFLLPILILGVGILLVTKAGSDCEKFLQWPLMAIGVFFMAISLVGLVGAFCRITWLFWLYVAVMFILALLLFSLTVFALLVITKGAGQAVSGRGYKEYRLEDYSNWLQKRVEKSSNWNKIKSCLQDAKVCKSLADDSINEVAEQFYKKNLSPIQSGCCKPPTSCGFVYVNATYWSSTRSNSTSTELDCKTWSNEEDEVCYNCDSCKAGVVEKLKGDWLKIAVFNLMVLIPVFMVPIAVLVVYCAGWCSVLRDKYNDMRDERKVYPYP